MKGYIFRLGASTKNNTVRSIPIPGPIVEPNHVHVSEKNALLIGWGDAPGDVWFAVNEGRSLLVLNGYLSSASFLGEFNSQQSATDRLLTYFDAEYSIERLGQCLKSVSGSFSILYVNIENEHGCLVTDRNSSRPIWLTTTDEGFIASSHAVALAYLSRERVTDIAGIASLLVYQTQLNILHSPFQGVRSLPEGTISIKSRGNDLKQHRWYRFSHQPDFNRSTNEWLDIVSDLFKSSARKILATCERPMIFLSGGLDSRLTAAAMFAVGGNPLLVSLCEEENIETKVAMKVAVALQGKHEVIYRDKGWYHSTVERAIFETGGCFNWSHGYFNRAYRMSQEQYGIDCALLGNWNEAFTKLLYDFDTNFHRKAWSPDQFADQIDSLMYKNYRPINRELTLDLLKPDVRQVAELALREDIINRYTDICHVSEDPRIIASYFFNWQTFSSLAPYFNNLDVRSAGPERTLMFDADLLNIIEQMPATLRDNANFTARLIGRINPAVARVVNSNTLLPINIPKVVQDFAGYARPKLGKIRRLFFDDSYKTTGSWPMLERLCVEYPPWKASIERVLLSSEFLPFDMFDSTAVKECWNDFCNGNRFRFNDVSILYELGLLNAQLS